MLRVGIAGIGFMGMIHYLAWQRVKGARVTAIASRDQKKLAGDWRSIKGNFGPPGEQMDLTGIRTYTELAHLINDPAIDLIDVCLPPHRHAEVTIAALAAGRHVLCEKPIALDSRSAAKMMRAAEAAERQLLVAHVLPFMGEFATAYKLVTGGKYGRLLGGHFKRIISDPKWIPDFFDPARVGGPMIDLHIHDAHFIRLLCGMPRAVFTTGRLRDGVAELFTSQFLFDDPRLAVTATSGVIGQQGRSFTHGFEIHVERATLALRLCRRRRPAPGEYPADRLYGRRQGPSSRSVESADPLEAFAAELAETVRSIRTGRVSTAAVGRPGPRRAAAVREANRFVGGRPAGENLSRLVKLDG